MTEEPLVRAQRGFEPFPPGAEVWTAFCAMPGTPRGTYDEEIDLYATRRPFGGRVPLAAVRRAAEAEIAEGYDPELRVKKIVRRFGIFW